MADIYGGLQEDACETDPWKDNLRPWLTDKKEVAVKECEQHLGFETIQRVNNRNCRRVKTILQKSAFEFRKKQKGRRVWVRVRPPPIGSAIILIVRLSRVARSFAACASRYLPAASKAARVRPPHFVSRPTLQRFRARAFEEWANASRGGLKIVSVRFAAASAAMSLLTARRSPYAVSVR